MTEYTNTIVGNDLFVQAPDVELFNFLKDTINTGKFYQKTVNRKDKNVFYIQRVPTTPHIDCMFL